MCRDGVQEVVWRSGENRGLKTRTFMSEPWGWGRRKEPRMNGATAEGTSPILSPHMVPRVAQETDSLMSGGLVGFNFVLVISFSS